MPPIYTWKNVDTGEEVQVVRKFTDIEVPPNENDGEGLSAKTWKRVECAGTGKFTRGAGWGSGKKGAW